MEGLVILFILYIIFTEVIPDPPESIETTCCFDFYKDADGKMQPRSND
jgi:hypothetical protein